MTLGNRGIVWGLGAVLALVAPTSGQELPADADTVLDRLEASPRHGELITYDSGSGDQVEAWVVYPERSDAAPVVIVIHEIFGMTDWIRGVADQVAAAGYIAIAPDLLSGKGPGGRGTESLGRDAMRAISGLDRDEVNRRLRAAAAYATALPSAGPGVAAVGFCWGGGTSFALASAFPELDGAVVYYGTSPTAEMLSTVQASVLGLYGGNDDRVNSTIPDAQQEMERLGKVYEPIIFDGAGHGFLRQQSGQDGANMEATRRAWARTLEFFQEVLGS